MERNNQNNLNSNSNYLIYDNTPHQNQNYDNYNIYNDYQQVN